MKTNYFWKSPTRESEKVSRGAHIDRSKASQKRRLIALAQRLLRRPLRLPRPRFDCHLELKLCNLNSHRRCDASRKSMGGLLGKKPKP